MKNFKEDFPYFRAHPNWVYFDSGATALKPQSVIDAESNYYVNVGANPHAFDYLSAVEANEVLDTVRVQTQAFIHARSKEEIVFTSGATFSLNLVANGLKNFLNPGDEIWISALEHSSNSLPWIVLANEKNLVIRELPLSTDFTIDVDKLSNEITAKAKVFAFASITNTIGAINDLAKISQAIRAKNPEAIIVVDATQSVAHEPIDVQKVDVDFLAFSAHKMYGPFGVGVLYGKSQWLAQIPPLTYGGGNNTVIDLKTLTYELTPVPSRFEAGSPNIAGIAAFGATLDFLNQIGFSAIEAHEKDLKNYLVEQFESKHLAQQVEAYNLEIPGPTFIFNVKGLNPQDVAAFLAEDYLIATRSGAHCARTIHDRHFKHSVRVTFGLYNTREDIDRLIEALSHLENVFDHLTR